MEAGATQEKTKGQSTIMNDSEGGAKISTKKQVKQRVNAMYVCPECNRVYNDPMTIDYTPKQDFYPGFPTIGNPRKTCDECADE